MRPRMMMHSSFIAVSCFSCAFRPGATAFKRLGREVLYVLLEAIRLLGYGAHGDGQEEKN